MKYRLNGSLLGLLKNQFFEFLPYYLGAFLCLYFTHSIQSLLPFYAKELSVLVEKSSSEIEIKKFFFLALGIIIFRSSSRLLFFYPARVLQRNLRLELLVRLENCLPKRYEKFSSGELFQILGSAMDDIRGLVGFALLQVGNIIIALIVLLPKLVEFNPSLAYALTPLLVGFIIFSLIVRTNAVTFKKGQEGQAKVQHLLMEIYQGKETIKNYFSEDAFYNEFKALSYKELWFFYKAGKKVSFSLPLIPLGLGASLVWGAYVIQLNSLGASSLILFIGFIYLFSEPMMFLAWIGVVFARSQGAWMRIKHLLSFIEKTDELENILKSTNKGEKDIFSVQFWGQQKDIKIYDKKWNVFIAQTGHGKSEILKQIANIRSLNHLSVSYVGQAPYLYDDNLLSNIVLGLEVDDELKDRIYYYLKLFELDFLAPSKGELFNLQVGENGKRLSGGQVKRICLIRSLISNCHFIIWDDPFSSVDLILEKKIMNKLKLDKEIQKKTFVLSSHRLSTVNFCDNFVYLEKNIGVIEKGNVAEKLDESNSKIVKYFQSQMFIEGEEVPCEKNV